jgi:hypothetical protein
MVVWRALTVAAAVTPGGQFLHSCDRQALDALTAGHGQGGGQVGLCLHQQLAVPHGVHTATQEYY